MNPCTCSYLRYAPAFLIICCGILSSCEKHEEPEKPVNVYEGNWKLTYFSDLEKPHNGPPSSEITLADGKMLWRNVFVTTDTANPIIETITTCNLEYSAITTMDDNSELTITEKYVLLDSAHHVEKEFNYSNTVNIKDGQTNYGTGSNEKIEIDAEHIHFYDYHWSGNTAYCCERRLEKIK